MTREQDLERGKGYQLSQRYTADHGTVFMTGIQALARLPLEQLRADRAAGLRTAAFVSGYPGSPLGGYDQAIAAAAREVPELPVVCRPALNEEYAATSVMGCQLAAAQPDARYDGVLGIWYGKAPGVDRASDALRHAVYAGSDPHGGALALVGDDPSAKSSTLPSSSAGSLFDLHIPLLYPGDPAEALDLGRHAIALSRCTGLWAGLKIVADVADGSGTVHLDLARVQPVIPQWQGAPYRHRPDGKLLTPHTLVLEEEIYEVRYALARAYASANRLNRATVDPGDAWIGIVSSGITAREVREALRRLGLSRDEDIASAGIRLLKMQMPMPFNPETLRHFARGLDELLVVEEKQPNLESLVKDALYNQSQHPRVIGKTDERDRPLLRGHGSLCADDILPALRRRLAPRIGQRLAPEPELPAATPLTVHRTPFYCSGCPHNRSTRVPEGARVGAGIGCHTMVMLMDPHRVGEVASLSCMGNEGTQWIGMSPFVAGGHLLQNLGDGTYFHSGQLAIQAAVAAGVDITYKLLWNGTVAMTGGQPAQGSLPLPAVARSLLAQGVKQVLVTTDDPARPSYRDLPETVDVWDRSRLLEAQERLARVRGVSVLIHDQPCAAGVRRARKRGQLVAPRERVVINPRLCEGCGDCGRVSNCLSVQPLETPFGRKMQVDQTSCNLDFSCLEGDCPAFMTVTLPAEQGQGDIPSARPHAEASPAVPFPDAALPEPALAVNPDDFSVRIAGIGGTGVVTVSQLLGTAALLDGYEVRGLDQIGLSQKAGPVVSDLRLRRGRAAETNRLGRGQADLILACDALVAASLRGLRVADPRRTAVVGSRSRTPTGGMVGNPSEELPGEQLLAERLAAVTRPGHRHWVDAAATTRTLFGDAMTANLFVVGLAVKAGCLPIRPQALEEAISLNGVAVECNVAAFRWGRCQLADPAALAAVLAERASRTCGPAGPPLPAPLAARVTALGRGAPELEDMLRLRAADLVGYQGPHLAAGYLESLEEVARRESAVVPGSTRLLRAVARGLHHLLAYKDEYEVARLMLLKEGLAPARRVAAGGGRLAWLLQPPLLRALGLRRKLRFGPTAVPLFRLLARLRWLRGRWLDPFGHTRFRRLERALPGEYRNALRQLLRGLKPALVDDAVTLAALPLAVRGYGDLKLARVNEYRARLADALARFES